MSTELHRPTCAHCNLLMSISEPRIMVYKTVFHEACFKKHMAEHKKQNDIPQEQSLQGSQFVH